MRTMEMMNGPQLPPPEPPGFPVAPPDLEPNEPPGTTREVPAPPTTPEFEPDLAPEVLPNPEPSQDGGGPSSIGGGYE